MKEASIYTYKGLKDSDIDSKRLERRLEEIVESIVANNRSNLTDMNVICEEIFGEILNRLYGLNLHSLSADGLGNFVAIDLIDYEKRVAFQVTSQYSRNKINKTIEKFNKAKLYEDIDELYFLILSLDTHKYEEKNRIYLENGNEFSYTKNIINLSKLIEEIEKKNSTTPGFIVQIYDCIGMIYDSGRLQKYDVLKETELLSTRMTNDVLNVRVWKKGYGDIILSAFIPLTYEEKLSCKLQIRQHNLSGLDLTFDENVLLADYLILEDEFEAKHNVGRTEEEEEMDMYIQNIYIRLNAHTVDHIYKAFAALKKEYFAAKKQIDGVLGTENFHRIGDKCFLMTIEQEEWKEVLFFANNHKCDREDGEIEWNIFNCVYENGLILSPSDYGTIKGVVMAKIFSNPNKFENSKVDLYWSPGYAVNSGCMDGFDNIIKWKADFTAKWIQEKLLKEAHMYYEKYTGSFIKEGWWKRNITMLCDSLRKKYFGGKDEC